MTDNTIRYLTPDLANGDSFDAGWYLLDDMGNRDTSGGTSDALSLANLVIIDANTPSGDGKNPITGGGDDDVFLIKSNAPNTVVISDAQGQNTIRFDEGVDVSSVSLTHTSIPLERVEMLITTTTGQGIQVATPGNMVFEFADTNHALHGLTLTAQQLHDYYADKPIFDMASYSVDVAVLNKVIPRITHQISDDDKAADTAITLTDTATEVDAGDGSDIITGGAGNDEITGGKGDDQIDLGADNTDTDTFIYGIGGRTAKDGADTVTNFNRGVDQFVFALESNADTAGITNYDGVIRFITKGTATLDDDEFMVQLDLGTDGDGNTQLEGLFFHFAGSSVFSGGRVSLPLMKISFAEPVDTAGIAGILTDDAGQPVNPGQVLNPYLFVTDLDYLDDFLGGPNAITFTINDI